MPLFGGTLLVFLQPPLDHLLKRTDGNLGFKPNSGIDWYPWIVYGLANSFPAVMPLSGYLPHRLAMDEIISPYYLPRLHR
jgi:hypothetical protein